MARRTKNPNQKLQAWIDARKLHHLSHAQVQMARELGMNPAKLGKIDNHKQEPWKLPLPRFIEELYLKRFGKTAPDAGVRPPGSRGIAGDWDLISGANSGWPLALPRRSSRPTGRA
jgi:hypothetical protein